MADPSSRTTNADDPALEYLEAIREVITIGVTQPWIGSDHLRCRPVEEEAGEEEDA